MRRTLRGVITLTALLTLGGCVFFPQEIRRDVQAVWSNDDASVLIAVSSYMTTSPAEPYFNATSSSAWKTSYYTANGTDLATRTLVGTFDDASQPGGLLQYEPMYWYASKGYIVVAASDPVPYAILTKEANAKVSFQPPADFASYLDAELSGLGIDGLYPMDAVPSPNGAVTAVLWQAAYDASSNPNVPDLQFNDLLTFYRTHDGTVLATVRLTTSGSVANSGTWPLAATVPNLHPYAFTTDAPSFTRLLWGADAAAQQGVYMVQPGTASASVFVPYAQNTTTPTGTSPVAATDVPGWPVPTTSCAVSDTGVGLVMTVTGNATALSTTTVSGWVPFESIGLVPFSSASY
jgi:hypothetical protein